MDSLTSEYCYLHIEYMPYSRMDRDNDSYVFSLKYITDFINSLNFRAVTIFDSHSDVSLALLNNGYGIDRVKRNLRAYLTSIGFNKDNDFLFFPDAGAQKRYSDLVGFKTLVGFKERDFKTGRIKTYDVVGDTFTNAETPKVVMLDDLCSKGGTFMLAAESLNKLDLHEIYLMVGHCEQTIFDGQILRDDTIKEVMTSRSMVRDVHKKIKLMEEL